MQQLEQNHIAQKPIDMLYQQHKAEWVKEYKKPYNQSWWAYCNIIVAGAKKANSGIPIAKKAGFATKKKGKAQ